MESAKISESSDSQEEIVPKKEENVDFGLLVQKLEETSISNNNIDIEQILAYQPHITFEKAPNNVNCPASAENQVRKKEKCKSLF